MPSGFSGGCYNDTVQPNFFSTSHNFTNNLKLLINLSPQSTHKIIQWDMGRKYYNYVFILSKDKIKLCKYLSCTCRRGMSWYVRSHHIYTH